MIESNWDKYFESVGKIPISDINNYFDQKQSTDYR